MTKSADTMPVGVILERRKIDNPWQEYAWYAVAVLPGAQRSEEWRLLREGDGWVQYHAGTLDLKLHHKETEGYRLNLTSQRPTVYIVLRYEDEVEAGIVPFLATVCPFEAQNYLDGDEDLVEAVPMPDVVAAWVDDFVVKYHVDEPRYKRKRERWDPRKRKGGPRAPSVKKGHGAH